MHKVLQRAAIKKKFTSVKEDTTLLDTVLDTALVTGGDALDMLLAMIKNNVISPVTMLNFLGSRLHRDMPTHGLQSTARILAALISSVPSTSDVIYHIVRTFPDILPILAQLLLANGSEEFLLHGLREWVEMPLFSARSSPIALKRSIALIFQSMTSPMAAKLITLFIRNLTLTAEDAFDNLLMICQLLSSGKNIKGDEDLALCLIEFAYKCKRAMPNLDTSELFKSSKKLKCPYTPLMPFVCTNPAFTENEVMSVLKLISGDSCDPIAHITSLFALADYPFLSEENEEIINNLLEKPIASITFDIDPSQIHEPFILLSSIAMQDHEAIPTGNWKDPEIAYAAFFNYSKSLLFKKPCGKLLDQLVRITECHPDLAQRLLLLISVCLKRCKSRQLLVRVVKCLLDIAEIDGFCRDRADALLRALCESSVLVQQVVIPTIARELSKHQRLADVIMSNLPNLLYSGNATDSSAAAYASTIMLMSAMSHKRTFMDFAFASIKSVLSARGKIRDLDPKTLAILMSSLSQLVSSYYVDPKIGKRAIKDRDFNGEICELVSLFTMTLPTDLESYEAVDSVIIEVLEFLLHNIQINPAASLNALFKFPQELLRSRGIDIMQLFTESIASRPAVDLDGERLSNFLNAWISKEIEEMPRSLFLGTSALKGTPRNVQTASKYLEIIDTKISLAFTSNPIYAALKISNSKDSSELTSLILQITSLPSLTMQHWLFRFDFINLVRKGISSVLGGIGDNLEFNKCLEGLTETLKSRIAQGQSVASVSYALLLWAILIAEATLVDANYCRSNDALKLILDGDQIPERFRSNEEIVAATVLSAKIIFDTLDETLKNSMQAELKGFLATLNPVETSWLWLSFEYAFGKEWPSLLNYEHTESNYKSDELYMLLSKKSWSLDEFTNMVKVCESKSKSEPTNLAGITLYGLGRSARNTTPEPSEWISSMIMGLKAPGPAVKKLEFCYALAGYLGVGSLVLLGSCDLQGPLQSALEVTTDARVQTWLVALLYHTQNTVSSPTVSTPVSGINRFGQESAFGCCLDILVDGNDKVFSEIILDTLCSMSSLPRLDWPWLPPTPSSLRFAWRHFQSTLSGRDSFVNKSLIQVVILGLETNAQVMDDAVESNKLLELVEAIGPDQETANRLLLAVQPLIRQDESIQGKTIIDALFSSDVRIFDQNLLEAIVESSKISTDTWKRIAAKNFNVPGAASLLQYLRTSDINDAIEACPEWSRVICSLISHDDIPNLISACILCPDDVDRITNLIVCFFHHQAHPFIQLAEKTTLDRLSWMQFKNENPLISQRVAKRVDKIMALLNPTNPLLFLVDAS